MQFESLIANLDKEVLIELLTKELPSLRAKIGISQDELSRIIGISRNIEFNRSWKEKNDVE